MREFLGRKGFELHGRKGGWKPPRIPETIAVDCREQIFRSYIVGHCEARLILEINEILNLFGFWKNDTKYIMDNWCRHGENDVSPKGIYSLTYTEIPLKIFAYCHLETLSRLRQWSSFFFQSLMFRHYVQHRNKLQGLYLSVTWRLLLSFGIHVVWETHPTESYT